MDAELTKKADELAMELASEAKSLDDLNGVMRSLMKTALERMLDTELDVHLGRVSDEAAAARLSADAVESDQPPGPRNRKNGTSPKTIQGDMDKLPLDIPRDRNGTFQPQLIAKHQRRLAGFDEKILALYAKGMTTRDIQETVKELYGVEISATLVSEISGTTSKIERCRLLVNPLTKPPQRHPATRHAENPDVSPGNFVTSHNSRDTIGQTDCCVLRRTAARNSPM